MGGVAVNAGWARKGQVFGCWWDDGQQRAKLNQPPDAKKRGARTQAGPSEGAGVRDINLVREGLLQTIVGLDERADGRRTESVLDNDQKERRERERAPQESIDWLHRCCEGAQRCIETIFPRERASSYSCTLVTPSLTATRARRRVHEYLHRSAARAARCTSN